jgi:uncharacterized protein (TIGR02996 family)
MKRARNLPRAKREPARNSKVAPRHDPGVGCHTAGVGGRIAKPARMHPLARAVAALDAGRDPDAVTALVEAWRDRRSPELAELVELLDARARARPFAELVTPRVDTTIERLRAVEHADDPRLSTVLLGVLTSPPFIAHAPEFWELVMTLVERLADPRVVRLAQTARNTLFVRLTPALLRNEIVGRLDELAGTTRRARAATGDETRLEAAIASRLSRARATKQSEADVLAEIYADPLADGPRLVYADLLLEREDPRGELITLQFKRRDVGLGEAEAKRERELLKKHMKTWLAGLAPVVAATQGYSSTTFERGFVARADLYGSAEKKLHVTWREPAWATVEELGRGYTRTILANAPLRALRRIHDHLSIHALSVFAARPQCFTHVEVVPVFFRDRLDTRQRELLAACDGLPALRDLTVFWVDGVRLDEVAWLLESPVARRLRRLVIVRPAVQEDAHLAGDRQAFEQLVALLGELTGHVPVIEVILPSTRGERPRSVELVRDPAGKYVHP